MRVILTKDVKNLGKKDEIREVSNGYARNYLIKNSLAKPATNKSLEETKRKQEIEEGKEKERKKKNELIAKKLSGQVFKIKVKAENEKLFGSVDKDFISKKIKEGGFDVDQESINLTTPIKKTGEYSIKIKLSEEIETNIRLIVMED